MDTRRCRRPPLPSVLWARIYDAMLAHCALKAQAETIYSWNGRHYALCGSEVTQRLRTPWPLLALIGLGRALVYPNSTPVLPLSLKMILVHPRNQSSRISFGQTASHSPIFVQLPKSSVLNCTTIRSARRDRSA